MSKYIYLKELGLDEAEAIVETICVSRQSIFCRSEKGMSNKTIDIIIEIRKGKSNFTIRYANEHVLLEFSDDEEVTNIEIPENSFSDLIIR